jgi:hypothetical protein
VICYPMGMGLALDADRQEVFHDVRCPDFAPRYNLSEEIISSEFNKCGLCNELYFIATAAFEWGLLTMPCHIISYHIGSDELIREGFST